MNLNILICFVCYISAQVADFMSSVGNRLIGGKSTVAGIREFHCDWSPNHVTLLLALPIFHLLRVSLVGVSVLIKNWVTQTDKFNY